MGIETAIGMGLAGAAGIFGAKQQSNAAKDARGYMMARNAQIDKLAQQLMGQNQQSTGAALDLLNPYLNPMQAPTVTGGTPVGDIDFNQIFGGQAYNVGQDGLMQLLRADPSRQLGAVDSMIGEMTATGNPFNTSQAFNELGALDNIQREQLISDLTGAAGSLGARFGSHTQNQLGQALNQFNAQLGARNAGLAMQSHEAAQGRRLAAGQLGQQLEAARNAALLQGIGLTQQDAGLRADVASQNQQSQLRQLELANALGMFNAQLPLQYRAQGLQAALAAAGLRQGQTSQNAQLLGIMAGLPLPGPNPAAGAMAGAIGDIGSSIAILPFLQGLLGNRSGGGRF